MQTVSRKADVTILTPDKDDFKTRSYTKNKEEPFSMIKVSTNQEDLTTLNMHPHSNRNSNAWSKMDRTNNKRGKSTGIGLYFNITSSIINRTSGEKNQYKI